MKANGLTPIGEEEEHRRPSHRKSTFGHLALFKGDDESGHASFISGYTTPGPKERATSEHKKVTVRRRLTTASLGQLGSHDRGLLAHDPTHFGSDHVYPALLGRGNGWPLLDTRSIGSLLSLCNF